MPQPPPQRNAGMQQAAAAAAARAAEAAETKQQEEEEEVMDGCDLSEVEMAGAEGEAGPSCAPVVAAAAAPPPPAKLRTLEIVVPPGKPPGSRIKCRNGGMAYTVMVPEGAMAGAKVQFKVAPQPAAAKKKQTSHTAAGARAAPATRADEAGEDEVRINLDSHLE